jgi:hypothetical protein
MQWQCVEFSRRWLILAHGITFPSVDFAFQIMDIPTFQDLDGYNVSISKSRNGNSPTKPSVGDLVIWSIDVDVEAGTGHVAVVTDIDDKGIFVGEANWDFYPWSGGSWSRKLPVTKDAVGMYSINDPFVLGWIHVNIGTPSNDSNTLVTASIVTSFVVVGVISIGLYYVFKKKRRDKKGEELVSSVGGSYGKLK